IKKDISDIFEPSEKKKRKLNVDRPRKPVIDDDDDDEEDEEDVEDDEEAIEENDEHEDDDEEDEEAADADTNMEVAEEIPGSTDVGDFALELGLSCNVCKQISVSKGNQLVECQECHSLYHQKCHKPFVSDAEINDPRLVWYCSRCFKSLKKMVRND
ncbi:integrator complex subunit 12-like, partial [Anneissia japonica]|uniref:integrator complex subunit 12-like n=1 Tax=Anneissia japonica TaxID=1529436 RepID=UPI0014258CC9